MYRLPCVFKALLFYVLFDEKHAYRNLVVPGITTAKQSSTFPTFTANRAIDGHPDNLGMFQGSCSHTSANQTEAWLMINLEKVYNVKEVRFWYRNDRNSILQNTIRLHNFSLYFRDTYGNLISCYRDNTNYSTPIPMPSTIKCPSKTRYIMFYTTQPSPEDNGQVFLEICEVEIYGCEQNQYGKNCTDCSAKCTECDIAKGCVSCQGKFTGSTCELCPPGYMESNCDTPCTAGWYGKNCSMKCSGHCFDDDTCFHKDGSCLRGCTPGYRGSTCSEECPFGTFGFQCNSTCGDGCKDKMCHSVTGMCALGCIDGRIGDRCDQDDLESPLESSYSFLLEAVAGTGALVAVIVVAAILIFWLRHIKTHCTKKKSAHSDEKDSGKEMSLQPKTSGIYENQHGCSSSAERRKNTTRELSNNPTDRPIYEVINKGERSTEEYDTLEF